MAKILLIISALVTAATAYLGFATKQKVDALHGDLSKAKTDLNVAKSDLTKAKVTEKKAVEDAAAAKLALDEKEAQVAKQKSDLDKLNADLTKAVADLEAAKKMGPTGEKIPGTPDVNVEELQKQIIGLTEAKNKIEGDLAEARQVQETMNSKVKDATEKLATTERQVAEYKQGFVRTGLTGSVLAYNPGWNFVVLSIGDRQGLKANTQLVVNRGGQMIAKVKVTSVEPSTSIADIVPGTVARGASVQPGDAVVYEGRSN
jgi:hypothetical protein